VCGEERKLVQAEPPEKPKRAVVNGNSVSITSKKRKWSHTPGIKSDTENIPWRLVDIIAEEGDESFSRPPGKKQEKRKTVRRLTTGEFAKERAEKCLNAAEGEVSSYD